MHPSYAELLGCTTSLGFTYFRWFLRDYLERPWKPGLGATGPQNSFFCVGGLEGRSPSKPPFSNSFLGAHGAQIGVALDARYQVALGGINGGDIAKQLRVASQDLARRAAVHQALNQNNLLLFVGDHAADL